MHRRVRFSRLKVVLIVVVVVVAGIGTATWLANRSTNSTTAADRTRGKAAPGSELAQRPASSLTSNASTQPGSSVSPSPASKPSPTSVTPTRKARPKRSTSKPAVSTATRNCTKPIFSSSEKMGTWTAADGLYVNNNMWNSAAGPQTIYVCSARSFYAVSNQPETTAVKTYPSVARNFDNPKVSSFSTITSSFGESIPAQGNWDAAYDIWTNNWNDEIMIWNNEHNQGQIPPSGSIPVTIDGQGFHAWQDGSDYVGVYMDTFETSGSVNILDVFKWLQAKGWMSATATLTAIGYGVEISETPGPETFQITNFSLTAH